METESRLVVTYAGGLRGKMPGEIGEMTAHEYGISLRADENVLESNVVMFIQL